MTSWRRETTSAAPDQGSAPLSLESSQNVVTEAEDEVPQPRMFLLSKCGCDCWFCPDCCERKGYSLRAELTPVLKRFTGLMMLTLTIDPELFAGPREAYFYVREKRGLSRLVRELGRAGHLHSRRYFNVLEFQRDTEQAHFHVLVDATHVPKPAIDAAWSKLRPRSAGSAAANRPEFGMTRFSKPNFEGGAEHAARYATKYLVKTPAYGWPAWVMELGRKVRVPRYSTSRGFWERARKPASAPEKTRESNPRSYAERVGECGTTCNLFETTETVDDNTGEIGEGLTWRARLEVGSNLIEILSPVESRQRHVQLFVHDFPSCINALERTAGKRISIISGRGGEERR